MHVYMFSHVQLFAAPWTVACLTEHTYLYMAFLFSFTYIWLLFPFHYLYMAFIFYNYIKIIIITHNYL